MTLPSDPLRENVNGCHGSHGSFTDNRGKLESQESRTYFGRDNSTGEPKLYRFGHFPKNKCHRWKQWSASSSILCNTLHHTASFQKPDILTMPSFSIPIITITCRGGITIETLKLAIPKLTTSATLKLTP